MAILNPEHLFQQAEKLIDPPAAGPPRQVDLRRVMSAAYYGVFHHLLSAAADQVVGATKRNSDLYALVYRSIDHRALRDLCSEAKKVEPGKKYHRFSPPHGFGPNIQAFASACLYLQERRHAADYDPAIRVKTSDANLAITQARNAVQRFAAEDDLRRSTFLTLLMFPPR